MTPKPENAAWKEKRGKDLMCFSQQGRKDQGIKVQVLVQVQVSSHPSLWWITEKNMVMGYVQNDGSSVSW